MPSKNARYDASGVSGVAISLHASAGSIYTSATEMSFTVDLKGFSDRSADTVPAKRPQAVTRTVAVSECDERPTDPAPPVHSFRLPKFPKDPGLPDVARLYEDALN